MKKKQKKIKFLEPDEEFDKYRYNTDKYYKRLWDDKILEENEIFFKFPSNKFYLACFDVLKDEIYFQDYFNDEIIHKNCLLNRHFIKYHNRVNTLHKYWQQIEKLTGFNKTSYISDKAKNYFKRPIISNFIYPETKGLFNNYNCYPLPCVMQNYGEFEITIKVHLNCFDIDIDENNSDTKINNNDLNENDKDKNQNNIFIKTFDEFEFSYKIPLLYVVDTIIQDTIDELKIFLLTKMKEKRKEMEEEEENNDNDFDEDYKYEINTNSKNQKRSNNLNKKFSKSNGTIISKEYLKYKNKLNILEEGQKNTEYRFVLKLSKFEEYLFGDYSIGSYECIRNYIRQYMKIPLVLIKRPKFEIKPRISSFPPIIMMEANKQYSYFNLLDKYFKNYPDKCAIFRFGETEKQKENEDREEKLTKYCESGECDCPLELTIVGIYNFKLMFEWLNDSNYNKNEMYLGYFNDFQTKEEYENSLFKNKFQKFFGCTPKNNNNLNQSHFHRSGIIEPGKINNENANTNGNNEDLKKKNKKEKKNQEENRKKELKEKKNMISLIRKSTKNETELQNKLNFLRLNKAGADSQNILFKYIFNSSSYPEDTERKINKLQTSPFYPFPLQKNTNYKHLKFSPTFITIKIELLYGSYDIEYHYSKNYIINDNIDIMEKIYFNTDKLIISHLPRETRLAITAFIVNKECSSKIEMGSGQIPLFNEKGEFLSGEIKINLWPLFKINPRINCCEQFLMKSQTIKAKRPNNKSYLREAKNELKRYGFKGNKKNVNHDNESYSNKTLSLLRRSTRLSSVYKRALNPKIKSIDNEENTENINKSYNENEENSDEEDEKPMASIPGFSTEYYNSNDFCHIILKFPKYARKMIHTQKNPISYRNFLNIKGFRTEENGKEVKRNPFQELFMVNEFNKVIEEFKETVPYNGDSNLINSKSVLDNDIKESEGENLQSNENEPFLEVGIKEVLEKLKELNKLMSLDPLTPITSEERKTILLCRDFLSTEAKGIDVFLRSINWFNPLEQYIAHLYLKRWAKLEPEDAIGLLDSRFPDTHVRELAIKTLSETTDDIIELYMMELSQCLFYENYYTSPLGDFIIEQSLKNQKLIGNKFYWCSKVASENFLFRDRIVILLTQLFMMSGPSFIDNITNKININAEFKNLSRTAKKYYPKEGSAKVNERVKNLIKERFNNGVCKFELPIHPSYCASGFEFTKLRVFSSKMVPIALNLYSSDGATFRVIFKIGDDLRQDSMILQIFKIMDKIWLENDLDLKLSIYNVCPLELKCGFVEFVEGTPLEEVQKKENDLGGALDKELLYKYLNNLSNEISKSKDGLPLDKELDNFIRSLAGYCVATGVMGIADRHPANVMIKKNGIFFHIDFGHIFGNFKKKFGFKRERSLFLLTPDMAYVYMKSNNKKIFINYCTNAFNILRRNAQRLLNITITMASSNMPEFSTMSDVMYFKDQLKLELNNEEEASDYFIRMIKETINDKYRIIDNLIHNCVHP